MVSGGGDGIGGGGTGGGGLVGCGRGRGLNLKMKFVCGQCWREGQVNEPDKSLKYCTAKAKHRFASFQYIYIVIMLLLLLDYLIYEGHVNFFFLDLQLDERAQGVASEII